ncbi:MAG TPA: PSD1 and planctomycete cytochrome C domain-containing protein [Opitutaceae bacterium]|nr:PSD1 and planctomycete cytochrome C domain-containing protein [Opitutaceae bacterium]
MKRIGKAAGVLAAAAFLAPALRAAITLTQAAPAQAPAPAASPADLQFFEARIRPVLVDRCYKCHSHDADKIKGGLMLDTREGMLHGGDTGPAIDPGKPEDSLMIDAIGYKDADLQMPPKGDRLPDGVIADITEWIRRGAPDPRTLVAKGSSESYGGVGRQHWSFLPVQRQAVPAVSDPTWCRTPVDNFILARLDENAMKPNAPADKYTLIRRATFDLTGLPPTEAEVQRFLVDDSPEAWAKVVDRLLASPHYGERWGRYWLDVARYADTKGDTPPREDPRYPFAWTYRDYVIGAFNSDKPYDQFITEQLAADRLLDEARRKSPNPDSVDQSSLAAMGFLTLGNRFENSTNDIINDRIDVTTKAFLGLTVSCARCHDHKFDPIPTADYYSLYDVFANTVEPKEDAWLRPVPRTPELTDYLTRMQAAGQQKAGVEREFVELRRSGLPEAERAAKRRELQKQLFLANKALADLEFLPAAPPKADVLVDARNTRDYPVLLRGEAGSKGPMVTRHFLSILSADPKRPTPFTHGSGRLELARAIASPSNPITARVLVNRVWQEHFGTGFVSTPDDLGNQSAPPTNPELLDYLSMRFMQDGWCIKSLQRLIMLSSAYQESSAGNPQYADKDPDNKLQWRYNLRQLDFEQMHDSILAIAGTIDLTMGGRPVPIGSEGFATRRAVYAFIDRRNPAEILTQFNFPNPSVPTGKRFLTQVPQQQLFLMNSPLVIETARKLVHSPDFMSMTTDELRVASLYISLFQRPPTPQEIALCLTYVESNPGGTSMDTPAQTAQSQRMTQVAERQAQVAANVAVNLRRKNAPQVEPGAGAFKSRAPLDAWTKLAHGLFQTNEAMFLN